jgi:hypothetical protein
MLVTVACGALGAAALGRHRVNAVFENTLICMLANGISLASIALLSVLAWRCAWLVNGHGRGRRPPSQWHFPG